jgi:protein-disulfide isomerase
MKDQSNGSTKLIALVLLLAVLAGAAYYFLSPKSDQTAIPNTPVATEQTAPTTTPDTAATTPTEPAAPVVVETKTLNLPAAAAPTIPASEKSSDPAVEAMMGVRKLGSDSAPIKVVEYSSLTCGHCAAFHKDNFPVIKTKYIDTGKVQFIFKEFPLNKPALDASKVLRCMPEDKFVAFQGLLFSEQEKWAYQPDYLSPLKQNAKLAGLSEEKIESCLNNKDLENRIIGDMKAGTAKFKIESTPTFIINDGAKTIVGHQAMSVFQETFDGILGGTAPAAVTPAAPATTPTVAPEAKAPATPEAAPTPATPAAPAPETEAAPDAPSEPVKD